MLLWYSLIEDPAFTHLYTVPSCFKHWKSDPVVSDPVAIRRAKSAHWRHNVLAQISKTKALGTWYLILPDYYVTRSRNKVILLIHVLFDARLRQTHNLETLPSQGHRSPVCYSLALRQDLYEFWRSWWARSSRFLALTEPITVDGRCRPWILSPNI